MNKKKATKQRGLVDRLKSVLVKPKTIRILMWVLKAISIIVRFIDWPH